MCILFVILAAIGGACVGCLLAALCAAVDEERRRN